MQASELLSESVHDTWDIHLFSQWLAEWIHDNRPKVGKLFTAIDILHQQGMDTLPIGDGVVSDVVMQNALEFVIGKDATSKRGNPTSGMFYPRRNLIWLSTDLVRKGIPSLASTIGHELRHAVDFWLSHGAPFTTKPGKVRNATYDEYMRDPQEINARFTQAMWAMLFDTAELKPKTPHEAIRIIDDCLDRLSLGRDLFAKGPKGDRQSNRLRSRAIRYWMEINRFIKVSEVERMPRQTLIDKAKALIARFNPFS